jgi:negative regulator of flagellin synthesis FlgM
MEIRSKSQPNPLDAYINQVQVRPKVENQGPEGPAQLVPKTDTVVISETAKRIQDAKASLDAIPDVRADKVAELKSRVENGTYEIQADKIAGKMIRDSLLNDLFK